MIVRKYTRLLSLIAALIVPAAASAAPGYSVKFLPSGFTAHDINNAGQIVGNTRTEAWIWSDSGIVNLSASKPGVQVYAINNHGEAAGVFALGASTAFIYSQGQFRDIGRPAGLNYATPHAINDNDQIAGTAGNFPGDTSRAFLFSSGTMTAIGTFGGDQGDAFGLNNKGTVVGSATLAPPPDSPRGVERGFVYRNGALAQIQAPGATVGPAYDINETGAIVGGADFASTGLSQPFLYAGGVLSNLGGPAGGARGINNHGAIVGTWGQMDAQSDLTHAFLYRSGTFTDLNNLIVATPGWTVTQAEDINDAGQILATLCFGSTLDCRSARLDLVPAVPEPAGVAMLFGGLMALAAMRRRQLARA
jgi:probable HAF family extracellular repeat protein